MITIIFIALIITVSVVYLILSQFFIGNWFLLASYAIFMLLSSITYILHQKHKNIKLIRKLNDLFDKTYYKPDYTDHELSALEQKLYNLIQSNKTITEQIQNEKERMNSLISDIAHQVKTPLSNIIMYADLLLEDKSSDNDKPMKIHMQAEKLRFLIDALIKMSRCENGLITGNLNIDHYNIKELLTRAVSDILPVARKKNITIYTNCDSKLTAFFDMKWTSEAIYNILDNAVKYSNANGTINIKVTPYEFFVRIDITDTGMGIPENEQADIWKRFYRGRLVNTENGVGIGLYLTKEILTSQHGYIEVASKLGKGSTFSVFLPQTQG
jgi:signal transduction histidine kinase